MTDSVDQIKRRSQNFGFTSKEGNNKITSTHDSCHGNPNDVNLSFDWSERYNPYYEDNEMYKSSLDRDYYNDYVFDHRDCNETIGCIQYMNYYDYYVFLHSNHNSNNCLQDKSEVVNQYDIDKLKDSLSFLEDYLESIDKPGFTEETTNDIEDTYFYDNGRVNENSPEILKLIEKIGILLLTLYLIQQDAF